MGLFLFFSNTEDGPISLSLSGFRCRRLATIAIKSQSPRSGKYQAAIFFLRHPTNSPALWRGTKTSDAKPAQITKLRSTGALDNSIPLKVQGFRLRVAKHPPGPGKLRVKQGPIRSQHKTPFPNGAQCTCRLFSFLTQLTESYFYFEKKWL